MDDKWYNLTLEREIEFSLDELKLIFLECQSLVKQSFDTSAVIITRTTIILSVLVSLFGAFFAFAATQLELTNKNYALLFTSIVMLIYIAILFFPTIRNLKKHDYAAVGSQPKDLLHDHFVMTESSKEKRICYYYVFLIKDYQKRFEKNNQTNNNRWARYNNTIRHLKFMPLTMLLVYFLSFIIVLLEHQNLLPKLHHLMD